MCFMKLVFLSVCLLAWGFVADEVFSETLHIGVRGPQTISWFNLDPANTLSTDQNMVLNNIYRGLIDFDSYANIIPGIAEVWVVSLDQKNYVFSIKKDVYFHDGEKVTADKVRDSIERVVRNNFYPSYFLRYVKGYGEFKSRKTTHLSGVKVLNSNQLSIELVNPFSPFLAYLATTGLAIVKEDKNGRLVGCGPYKIAKIIGGNLYLDRWGHDSTNDSIRSIVIHYYNTSREFISSFTTGQTDFIYNLYPNEIIFLKEHKNEIKYRPALATFTVFLNVRSNAFKNEEIRRWILCKLNEVFFNKRESLKILKDYLPTGVFGHRERSFLCPTKETPTLSTYQKNRSFKIVVPEELTDEKEIKQLTEIFSSVGLQPIFDIDSYGNTYYDKLRKQRFDAIYLRIIASINDPDFFYLFLDQQSPLNYTQHNDIKLSKLIQKAAEAISVDERISIYEDLNNYLFKKAYILNLWQPQFAFVISKKFDLVENAYRYYPSFEMIKYYEQ